MSLRQDIEHLAAVPVLGVLEPSALRLLAFTCETRIIPNGDELFRRDHASEGGFLVLSGRFKAAEDDRTPRGPGSLLEESALLRETVHEWTAVATETATIMKLQRRAVLRVLEEHPISAQRVLAFYASRLRTSLPEPLGP